MSLPVPSTSNNANNREFVADDYTVGWVCALPCEAAAAKAMLDERHPDLLQQDPDDYNSYYLGRIQGHYVAIACLPAGVYGTTPASAVAKDMLRTFKSIRFGLMVGIGGGAPSSQNDIRLGDVVISQPTNNSGGVIQQDRGKLGAEGKLSRTGSLNTPPKILLNALSRLQTELYSGEDLISKHLTELLDRGPKWRKIWGSPGAEKDRLYRSDCPHIEGKLHCNDCDASQVVNRPARDDDDPVVHCGIIASGNQVVKDASTRDCLARQLGALCFEMEAAGLMLDFPCIVIRGICDYSDSHKNKAWQSYASATAAACAKGLLSLVAPSQVLQQKCIPQQVSDPEVHRLLSDGNQSRLDHETKEKFQREAEKRSECHRSFKTSTYELFKDINPDRVVGTCRWVLEHEQFKKWRNNTHDDLLWISADPGCGKSVLAKSIVDNELKSTNDHTVCYFFFKDNKEQNDLTLALSSLLHQLFTKKPTLIKYALGAYDRNGEKTKWEEGEMWRILETAARDQSAGNITCVLDALDECEYGARIRLLELLTKFYKRSYYERSKIKKNQLHFLVTSRPYHEIEFGFNKIPEHLPSIRLAGEDRNSDIIEEVKLVIKARVSEAAVRLNLGENTKDALHDKLMSTQNRTYLWLHLTMSELYCSSKQTTKALLKKIETLPMSVDQAYEKILSRHDRAERPAAETLLHLIVAARRPLKLGELDVALALSLDSSKAEFHSDLDLDGHRLERRIRKLCGLFVFVHGSRVYLIHQTAKEFLIAKNCRNDVPAGLWKESLDPRRSNAIFLHACLQYLSFRDILQRDECEYYNDSPHMGFQRGVKSVEVFRRAPFLDYCISHWLAHLGDGHHVDEATYERCVRLFDPRKRVCQQWLKAWSLPDALYAASYVGHASAVSYLLNLMLMRFEFDGTRLFGKEALHGAVLGNQSYLFQTFVVQGVDDKVGHGIALRSRRWKRYESVVRLLVKKWANINEENQFGQTPLHLAVSGGDLPLLKCLLECGADIHRKNRSGQTPLRLAISRGDVPILKIFLNFDADINQKNLSAT